MSEGRDSTLTIADVIRDGGNADVQDFLVQVLTAGWMLGCGYEKEARQRVDTESFADRELGAACAELQGNGKGTFAYLSKVLCACGVIWKPEDGPPVDAILAQLEQNGQVHQLLRELVRILGNTPRASPEHKRLFIEGLERLQRESRALNGASE